MREQITEVVKYAAPSFEKIKITGTSDLTKIEGFDKDKVLFLVATLKEPVAEFIGEFGVGSLNVLGGLLAFSSYKAEDSEFKVHRSKDGEYVAEFEFKEKRGGGARFKTMNPRLVEQPHIANIPWQLTVSPSKSAVAELTQLAGLLSEVDTMFGVSVENETLFVTIGGGASGTHTGKVAFATDVTEVFNAPNATYNTRHLLSILKSAGSNPAVVRFSERGVAGISIDTALGSYNYYLRAKPV